MTDIKISNGQRLYPYSKEAPCPKCGSFYTSQPVYHLARHRWFFAMWLPLIHLCPLTAMDHLHYKCQSCDFSFASACRDVLDRL